MLVFLTAVVALIQQLLPLLPTVAGVAETIKQLWDLGSRVSASGADPTHDDWAALVAIQSAALDQVHKLLKQSAQSTQAVTASDG